MILATLLSIPAALGQADPEWTWIHGQLDRRLPQRKYLEYAREKHNWYQEQGLRVGRLVAEEDLESLPNAKIVVIGPLEAFEDFERFGLPIEAADDGAVTIGGRTFEGRRTGIYLANRDETRIAYTGLSLSGFRDIFSVPTGTKACTVTGGKHKAIYEGDWGEDGLVLRGTHYVKTFPTEDELRDIALPVAGLSLAPVVAGSDFAALAPEFKEWLAGFVERQRVLFVGESHWNDGVKRLFNRIVEELLEQGRLRSIFLETNYSFSGFYDHYVSEADDERAARFLEKRLHPLVTSPNTLELLKILRTWNTAHPDRRVRVGCVDMEWGFANVIQNVLEPYFRRVDEDFDLSASDLVFDQGGIERLQELLARARDEGVQGEHPFLTPEYMETVLTNLGNTREIEDQQAGRQRWIIRNVTEFHGDLLQEGLAVFHGGGWHAIKHKIEGESFYRDAAYLHEVFEPTRGKVVTLLLQALSYRFGEVADLDPADQMSSATNYQNLVRDFRKALAEDRADRDAHYVANGVGLIAFDRIVARLAYQEGWNVLRIASVDWEALARTYGQEVTQVQLDDQDATVYIMRGGLEVMRPRVFTKD